MKLIAYILSIYIIMLTFAPCVDVHLIEYCNSQETSVQNQNNSEEEHTDTCSPLCACNCCSTSTLLIQTFIIDNVSLFAANIILQSKDQFVSSHISNIWQPPQL